MELTVYVVRNSPILSETFQVVRQPGWPLFELEWEKLALCPVRVLILKARCYWQANSLDGHDQDILRFSFGNLNIKCTKHSWLARSSAPLNLWPQYRPWFIIYLQISVVQGCQSPVLVSPYPVCFRSLPLRTNLIQMIRIIIGLLRACWWVYHLNQVCWKRATYKTDWIEDLEAWTWAPLVIYAWVSHESCCTKLFSPKIWWIFLCRRFTFFF